jgi:hypothetical protein
MHFSDIIFLHHETVSLLPKLKQALQQYGKEFKYSGHPHDKQGIIYWLGTRKGTLKNWTNPIFGKQLDIEAQNVRFDGEHLTVHRFFETYETGHVQIAAKAPHFNLILIVKLHPSHILVKPSAYTLGYYKGGSGACMLRNWTFSGSIDGVNWDVLKKHVKDESITVDSAFTWHLDCTKKYNQFKIERTGVVSGGDTHYYTAFSGLEIYGTVYKSL